MESDNRIFRREHIDTLLTSIKGKTLEEVDSKGIIAHAISVRPDKVTKGIAGDVIEQSVLGFQKDCKQKPDLVVDDVKVELKTTGVRHPKKDLTREYEPKEPLTITGVSPNSIIHEEFKESHFFKKIEHILFVFYHYSLKAKAQSSEDYKNFLILGHMFWNAPDSDMTRLENDWHTVKKFFLDNKDNWKDKFDSLQKNLLLIDTSSPQRPRFRFKRAYVTTIVDTFLHCENYTPLPQKITKFADIDEKCHAFTTQYKGNTLKELSNSLRLELIERKDACQQIIIKLFGGEAKSLNQIKDFREIGLIAKTVILTSGGRETEDMKMCRVDFDEWCRDNVEFADSMEEDGDKEYSSIYSYFAEQSFVFIIFKEPYKPQPGEKIPLSECQFVGFKRYAFSSSFIHKEVERTWKEVRALVINRTLKEESRGGGLAPNFPKSKDHVLFLRGSGSNSKDRRERLSDWGISIKMYTQYAWLRGDFIVNELSKEQYL